MGTEERWHMVCSTPGTWRLSVPGGWLYRVEAQLVFVPDNDCETPPERVAYSVERLAEAFEELKELFEEATFTFSGGTYRAIRTSDVGD